MHATHCNVYLREMHITFPEAFETEKKRLDLKHLNNISTSDPQNKTT